MPADLIIRNGVVYGSDKSVTALAVNDDVISALGSDKEIMKLKGESTKIIDAAGKSVLPSFFDSHLHPSSVTEMYITKMMLDIVVGPEDTREGYTERIMTALKEFADEHPDDEVVRATGWNPAFYYNFPEGMITREDIDKVVPDRPVFMRSYDHHGVLVNTELLRRAGIDENTPDPAGGVIHRDADGYPTGFFQETPAVDVIFDHYPQSDFSVEEMKIGIMGFQNDFAIPNGIFGVFDAYPTKNAIEAYRQLAEEGKLKIRVRGCYFADPTKPFSQFEQIIADKGKDDVGEMFRIDTVKFFCDGGGFTFLLNEPFEPAVLKANGFPEGYKGVSQWTQEAMNEAVAVLAKAGYQVHVHAMGDGAVKQTLNAFQYAKEQGADENLRHSIAHIMLIDEDDIKRMAELNVVASMQPSWAMWDDFTEMSMVPLLGKERTENQYPLGRIKKAGAVVSSGTDFPILALINPLVGIEIGVLRSAPESYPGYDKWKGVVSGPEGNKKVDCMTLDDMIDSYTVNGAYQMFLEERTGSLEVGKSADMLIMDRDYSNIESLDIEKAKIVEKIFMGKVY